jgi:hypothetical protein
MKRLILSTFIIAFSLNLSAQNAGETVQNQYIAAHLLGVEYGYEKPLATDITLLGKASAGMQSIGYSSNSWTDEDGWFYTAGASVGAEMRYYYNLKKRLREGKDTRYNSGNFWSLGLEYNTPSIYKHNADYSSSIALVPAWGFKKVYKNNLMLELNLGWQFGYAGGEFGTMPKIDFKFGYRF